MHLGTVEGPGELSCRHFFCCECPKENDKTADLICPVCGVGDGISNIDDLLKNK